MNLREGNVFTAVCLSFCSCCIGPPCTELPGFVPLSYLQTWDVIVHRSPPLPPWWHRVVITGDLFKLNHFRIPSPCCWHLVAIETWTVSASRWFASFWNVSLYIEVIWILLHYAQCSGDSDCFKVKENSDQRLQWGSIRKYIYSLNISSILKYSQFMWSVAQQWQC